MAEINKAFEGDSPTHSPDPGRRRTTTRVVGKLIKEPSFIMTTVTTEINYDDLVLAHSGKTTKMEDDEIPIMIKKENSQTPTATEVKKNSTRVINTLAKEPSFIMTAVSTDINYDDLKLEFEDDKIPIVGKNENSQTPTATEVQKNSTSAVNTLAKQPSFIMATMTTDINYEDLVREHHDTIENIGPSVPANKSCGQECIASLGMVVQGCGRLVLYGMYLYDMVTDVKVSLLYIERKHHWWGTLGLTFFGFSWICQCALAYDKVTYDYIPTADNRVFYGRLSDRRVAKILFLLLPLIQITWSTYELVFGKVNNAVAVHRKISAYRVKLTEVMLEAFPQILLQIFVILRWTFCASDHIKSRLSPECDTEEYEITPLQWLSLANSLISISIGLANGFMFQEIRAHNNILLRGASWIPYKSSWLILSGITVGCRIYVCAVWGAVLRSAMILIPLLTGFFTAIGIWGLRAYYPCKYWTRAGLRFGDRGGTFEEKAHIVVSWIGTLLGNGFSDSGMVLSLVFLVFSAIPCIYTGGHFLTQIGFGIAAVAAVANIITLITAKGQKIAQRWVDGQYKVCKAGQQQWFNGRWRGALEGEKYYSFRYY